MSIRDESVPALPIKALSFNYRALVSTHFKLLWQLCKCVSVAKYQVALVQLSKVVLDAVFFIVTNQCFPEMISFLEL